MPPSFGVTAERNNLGEGLHGVELVHVLLYPFWMQAELHEIDCAYSCVNISCILSDLEPK